jgi:hypothetical protein
MGVRVEVLRWEEAIMNEWIVTVMQVGAIVLAIPLGLLIGIRVFEGRDRRLKDLI